MGNSSSIVPCANPQRQAWQLPKGDGLDFTGIDFPTPLSQISKIEKQNDLAITVFGWCKGKTVVVRVSEVEDPNTRRIHLMMLTNKHTTHYCYIKSLSRLLSSEYAAGRRIHFCDRCLQGFSSARVLNDHLYYCRESKAYQRGLKCQRRERTLSSSRTTRTR